MSSGKVFLVGAGPGDPGLLTVRGLNLLRRVPVIVYDQLVNPELLEHASPDALKIFVGKREGHHCIAQKDINYVLVGHARAGHDVVRLKGGDPMLFGRAHEEISYLRSRNVAVEVVPGDSISKLERFGIPAGLGTALALLVMEALD